MGSITVSSEPSDSRVDRAEAASNCRPREMIVHDKTRLIDPLLILLILPSDNRIDENAGEFHRQNLAHQENYLKT